MSDEDFWDIDQYQTTRHNREIGAGTGVRPVGATAAAHPFADTMDQVIPANAYSGDERRRRKRRQPKDIAEIHGLAEKDLDDSTRRVLADLIQEIGHLHDDFRMAEGRIRYLEEELRHDTLGDWLDRKGFLGRLSQLLSLDQQEHAHSSLALFRLRGFAESRSRFGWRTADDLVAEMGGLLAKFENAVVGHVADNMFGMLMVGTSAEKADAVLSSAIPKSVTIPGQDSQLRIDWVTVALTPGKRELEFLSAADRKLAQEKG